MRCPSLCTESHRKKEKLAVCEHSVTSRNLIGALDDAKTSLHRDPHLQSQDLPPQKDRLPHPNHSRYLLYLSLATKPMLVM